MENKKISLEEMKCITEEQIERVKESLEISKMFKEKINDVDVDKFNEEEKAIYVLTVNRMNYLNEQDVKMYEFLNEELEKIKELLTDKITDFLN